MRRHAANPAEYLAGLEGWQLAKVEQLRRLILDSAPQEVEAVRGGILYYDDGGDLFALAAQKHYVSLYVLAPGVLPGEDGALEGLDRGKGCVRFKARTEVPEAAIGDLLRRAAAASARNCGKG